MAEASAPSQKAFPALRQSSSLRACGTRGGKLFVQVQRPRLNPELLESVRKKMKLSDIYCKSLKKKWVIRLKTRHPDGDHYDGVVLKETQTFVVLAQMDELEFDGVTILAKRFIKGFRDNRFESCYNKIIRFNGAINKLKIPGWVDRCESLKEVIKECQKRQVWPGIEALSANGKDSAFYVGPVVEMHDESFKIFCYDADATWEKDYSISYKQIFKVCFHDRYTTHFNKFMKAKYKKVPSRKA